MQKDRDNIIVTVRDRRYRMRRHLPWWVRLWRWLRFRDKDR